MYSREIIEEMNILSKEVLGSKNRWRKLVEEGVPVQVTEDTTRYIPGPEGKEEESKTEVVKTPVLHYGLNDASGINKFYTKRYTVEEAKEYLLKIKTQYNHLKKQFDAMQNEQKAKQKAENIAKSKVAANSGSASV